MFGFTNHDIQASGPSSAPPNAQSATTNNHFPFPYFAPPLNFYSQLNQQLNQQLSYDPTTPNSASINNLANSFQQQFHTNSGIPTPAMSAATTPLQPDTTFFNHQSQNQPGTSVQTEDYANLLSSQQPSTSASSPFHSMFPNHLGTLQHQQSWPQAWPSNSFQQPSSFYNPPSSFGYTPTTPGIPFLHESLEQTLQQYMGQQKVEAPDESRVFKGGLSLPKDALDRTVVILQRQNPYTLTWSEKTSQMYFRKWFDATFNIPIGNIDKVQIICMPEFIIGFYAFDVNTAKYLVKIFADGQLRNDVLLKSASDFMIQMMKQYNKQIGQSSPVQTIDDAFNILSDIKKQAQQSNSAPPYTDYNPFVTNNQT